VVRDVSPRVVLDEKMLKSDHSCLIPNHMHDSDRRGRSLVHRYCVLLVFEHLVARIRIAGRIRPHSSCKRPSIFIQEVMLHCVVDKCEVLRSQKPNEIWGDILLDVLSSWKERILDDYVSSDTRSRIIASWKKPKRLNAIIHVDKYIIKVDIRRILNFDKNT